MGSLFDIAPISPIGARSKDNFGEKRGKGFSVDQGRQNIFNFSKSKREVIYYSNKNMLFDFSQPTRHVQLNDKLIIAKIYSGSQGGDTE